MAPTLGGGAKALGGGAKAFSHSIFRSRLWSTWAGARLVSPFGYNWPSRKLNMSSDATNKVSAGQAVKQTIKERCESNVSPAFLVR